MNLGFTRLKKIKKRVTLFRKVLGPLGPVAILKGSHQGCIQARNGLVADM